jgi:LmbE family N-acetylglucosaminyl deacetylase
MNILVISPHPDDESIGCGGTLGIHIDRGDIIHVIFLTSGEKGGHGLPESETKTKRETEAKEAAYILNIAQIDFWEEPDGNFKATDQTIQKLVKKRSEFKPNIIYAPHIREQHPDHQEAAKMVIKSHEIMTGNNCQLWFYEIWTPLEHLDHIVDISNYVDLKRKAIKAHASQCNILNFDEAILGLNRYRGEMHSWPGGEYAEVFSNLEHQTR